LNIPEELVGLYNYEDTWVCLAAREKGYKTIFQPSSVAIHHEGESKRRNSEVQEKVNQAKKLFTEKWRNG
jgi:GT2 family glycosyltransferase